MAAAAAALQTKITISAEDKASSAFRVVGAEADSLVEKLLGMGPKLSATLGLLGGGGIGAGMFVKDSALAAARYETLGIAMDKAGENAGKSKEEMALFEGQLVKNGIAMQESRALLARLSAANIDLARSAEIARVAQDVAVVANTNSSEAFDRLVQGIITAQPEMLRTLGIAVNFEQEYAKAAQAMGKSAAHLTNAEKLQIRLNAALEAGGRYAGIYELSMQSASKQLGSFTRLWSDFQTLTGSVFLDALSDAVFGVNARFQDWNATLREMKDSGQLKEISLGMAESVRALTGNLDVAAVALGSYIAVQKIGASETLKMSVAARQAGETAVAAARGLLAQKEAAAASALAALQKAQADEAALAVQARHIGVTTQHEAAFRRLIVAEKQYTLATAEAAVATGALDAAQKRAALSAAASSAAQAGLGRLKSSGQALLGMFGGPWGLALTAAATGVYALATADSAAEKAAKSYGTTLSQVEERYRKLSSGAKDAAKETAGLTEAHKKALEEQTRNAIDAAQKQVEAAKASLSSLSDDAGAAVYDSFGVDISSTKHVDPGLIEKLKTITKELREQSITAEEAEIRFRNLKTEAENAASGMFGWFNPAKDALKEFSGIIDEAAVHASELGRQAKEVDKLSASLGLLVNKGIDSAGAIKEIAAAMKLLESGRTVKPADTLEEAITALRSYTKETKAAKAEAEKTEQGIAKANLAKIKQYEADARALGKTAEADKLAAEALRQGAMIPAVIAEKHAGAASKMESAKHALQGINAEIAKLSGDYYESFGEKLAQKLDDIAKKGKDAGLSLQAIRVKQEEYRNAAALDQATKQGKAFAKLGAETAGYYGDQALSREIKLAEDLKAKKLELMGLMLPTDNVKEYTARVEDAVTAWEKAARQEIQVKDMQTAVNFLKELEQMSGQYGLSIDMNNRMIEQQAQLMRQNSGIAKEYIDQWIQLKQLENARDPFSGMQRGLIKYSADASNYAKQMETSLTNAFQGAEDALVEFVMAGEFNFQSLEKSFTKLANSIISDIVRMMAKQAISGLGNVIGKAFGGLFSGGASMGGVTAGESVYMQLHDGGVVGAGAPLGTRAIPASFFDNAPRYHQGAYIASDERRAILQTGERVLSRTQNAGLERALATGMNGGGRVINNINITPPSGFEARTEQRQNAQGGMDMSVMFEQVDGYIAGGIASGRGKTAQALKMTGKM